jgi:hypothetical protein
MSERILEQRINTKSCANLGKSVGETLDMLRVAYGDNALIKSSVFERRKVFKEGRKSVKGCERPGQPKSQRSCVEAVLQLFGQTGD